MAEINEPEQEIPQKFSQEPFKTSKFETLKTYISSINFKNWLPLAILVIGLPLVVLAALQVQNLRQRAAPAVDSSLLGLSNSILQKGSESVLRGSPSERIQNEYEAINSAKTRKDIMLKKAQENPKEFLLYAFPKKIKDGLTQDAQQYIENEVDLQGELAVLHFDNFNDKKDKTEYRLLIKSGKKVTASYIINFADKVPTTLSGSKVRVKGYQLDNNLVTQGGDGGGYEVIDPQQTNSLGDQKTLVIMFNFKDDNYEPVTKSDVQSYIFGSSNSVNSYYKETSYNKTSFSGDIVGYYKIPYSNLDCNSYYDWATSADAVAFANGVNLDNYARKVYVFPNKGNCWASAWATIGGTPSQVWITDSETTPDFNEAKYSGIYSHELGHNLGVAHANSYECRDKQVGDFQSYSDCSSKEYGDPTDVMGFTSWTNIYGFNAAHRDEVKWLDAGQVVNVSSDGTFNINTLEQNSSSIKALKIAIPSSNQYYYVSYRQPLGYDSSLGSGITGGASIHIFYDSPYVNTSWQTNLIDNYPEGQENNDFSNSSLKDAGLFNDPYNGIKITQVSHNSASVTVNVSLDKSVCRRGVPDFTIDPITQVGSVGQALSYQMTLKNNDTPNCGSTSFNFSDDKYDWGSTYSQSPVTLNPGESKVITKTVTPPTGSRIGIYTINTTVSSSEQRHTVVVANSFIVTGDLGSLNVSPGIIQAEVGKEVGMSALAYDTNGNQIRAGVTYEWSMSSTNSVATLSRTQGVVSTVMGLRPGFGEITVIARFNGTELTKTVQVNITGAAPTPTFTPTPTPIKNQTLNITSKDDSYVKSSLPSKNFGTSTTMWVDASPLSIAFLKYDLKALAGKTIVTATLKINIPTLTNAQSTGKFKLNSVLGTWAEKTLKYSNRPQIGGQIGSFGPVKKGQTINVDLTAWVAQNAGNEASFAIQGLSSDDAAIRSKESATASTRPVLIIQYK